MLCPNCGALLAEGSRFCPFCNSAIEAREAPSVSTLSLDSGIPEPYRDPSDAGQQPNYGQQPYYGQQPPYNRGYSNGYVPPVSTGGYIAWAILTALLLCRIPGIIGLIFALKINKSTSVQEQQQNIKITKICCLIGTILGILILVLYAVYYGTLFSQYL